MECSFYEKQELSQYVTNAPKSDNDLWTMSVHKQECQTDTKYAYQ